MESGILVSDADREHVVTALGDQVGTGRLTLAEFSERSAAAYRSRTTGELDALTRDLPRPVVAVPIRTSRARPSVILTLAVLAIVLALGATWLMLATPDAPSQMIHTMNHMMGNHMMGNNG